MRALILFSLALAAVLMARPSPAAAYYYPWCGRYADRSGATICNFLTQEQCLADVSGRGGFCVQNAAPPPFRFAPAYEEPHLRHSKRHHHVAAQG